MSAFVFGLIILPFREHGVEDAEAFVGDGDEADFGWFSGGGEAVAEGLGRGACRDACWAALESMPRRMLRPPPIIPLAAAFAAVSRKGGEPDPGGGLQPMCNPGQIGISPDQPGSARPSRSRNA